MPKIISVVGARPNFMKVAPIRKSFQSIMQKILSLSRDIPCNEVKLEDPYHLPSSVSHLPSPASHLICHTGQHYDEKMSKIFFNELEMPKPDFYLGVGSCTHAEQTAKIMVEFEKVLMQEKPDLVIVVGDVNSTIACSLTAVKLGIKVAHVEAGLRSFDRTMPEEINRILTDSISEYLFVTEKSGLDNLELEGISKEKIFFVGNVMIDSLIYYLPKSEKSSILNSFLLSPFNFVLVTLHRPANVDDPERMKELIQLLNIVAEQKKVFFRFIRVLVIIFIQTLHYSL